MLVKLDEQHDIYKQAGAARGFRLNFVCSFKLQLGYVIIISVSSVSAFDARSLSALCRDLSNQKSGPLAVLCCAVERPTAKAMQ